MRIFQIIVTITTGDAIGNNALLLDNLFRSLGFETGIYAINIDSRLSKTVVRDLKRLPQLTSQDIIIYHMCESTIINAMLGEMHCKKIAVYHNTTPARFFARFEPEQAKKQVESLLEIKALSSCFDWCIADSEFNKADLVRMGYPKDRITVIPIMLNFEDYRKTPDQNVIKTYQDGRTNFLFVGRVAPNKCFEDVIQAYAYYKKHIDQNARLFLVGAPFGGNYINYLREYVEIIEAEDVIFTGHVTFAEILAYYSVADIFLCMSEHEGFCVPVIEAMIFGVPVLAFNSSAIKGTLGGCGILLEEKDPVVASLVIQRILNDKALKDYIIDMQKQRLNDFDVDRISKQFMSVLQHVAGGAFNEEDSHCRS